MNRFWKFTLGVAAVIAVIIAVLGVGFDWNTAGFTKALALTSLVALFVGTASFGGTGPGTAIGQGPLSGDVFEAIAYGEETRQAYKSSGRSGGAADVVRARRGWNPGNYAVARAGLAVGALYGIGAVVCRTLVE